MRAQPARKAAWATSSGLFVGALLVHLAALAALGGFDAAALATPDYDDFYHPVALALLDGRGPTLDDGTPAVRYPPGFPALVAAALGLGGAVGLGEAASVRWLLALSAAASTLALHRLARVFVGPVAAFVAAILWATYPPFVVLSTRAVSDVPFLPLVLAACAVWAGATVGETSSRRRIALGTFAGVLAGAAALIRPAALLLPIPLLALALWRIAVRAQDRSGRSSTLTASFALLLTFAATIAPWMLWTHERLDRWIPLSTGGRLSLLDGLTISTRDDSSRSRVPQRVDALMHAMQAERSSIRSPGDAVAFLVDRDPAGALQLLVLKAARSWYATDSLRHDRALAVLQVPYLLLAAVGLVLGWRRAGPASRGRALVALTVPVTLYFWALTILVLSILRYMLPAMALLTIPAALALAALVRRPIDDDPRARIARRAWLRKTGRRLLSEAARGRLGTRQWRNDLVNFTNLALDRPAARGDCTTCRWTGVFLAHAGRRRQICLVCGSRARHRTLSHVLRRLDDKPAPADSIGLHVAPERCLVPLLETKAARWVRGDLQPDRGDSLHEVGFDLRRLPFADSTFHWVVANHVLEHIFEDRRALAEIHRVLAPCGVAVLMVPVVAESTLEYGFEDPARNGHARDCGPDYFDRYREAGFEVELLETDTMAEIEERHALLSVDGDRTTSHQVPLCRKPSTTARIVPAEARP